MSCLLASKSISNAIHMIFHLGFDQIGIYSLYYIHKKKFRIFTPSIITAAGNNPHCFFASTNQTQTICVRMPTPGPHTVLYPINQKVKIDKKEHKNPSQCFFQIIRKVSLVLLNHFQVLCSQPLELKTYPERLLKHF